MFAIVAASILVVSPYVGRLFVADPVVLAHVVPLLVAACVSVVFSGLEGGATGPLRASGDTRWPLYANLIGMYVFAVPLLGLGVVLDLGLVTVMGALVLEKAIPAAIIYYRYRSGAWTVVSRQYRPDAATATD